MTTDPTVAKSFQSFEPSCLYPRTGGGFLKMVVRPGFAWQEHEPQAVEYEGKIGSARVMPCGHYGDDGKFREQMGVVLVVWHGPGPRAVAVLPEPAVLPKAAAPAAPAAPVARRARRSGWAPRVPPVPVPAAAAAAAGWQQRGPLPVWAPLARQPGL